MRPDADDFADDDFAEDDFAEDAADEDDSTPIGKRSRSRGPRRLARQSSTTSAAASETGTPAAESPAVLARRAALNWLARREHSFHELLQKLSDRFPDADRNEVLIPALQQLQDDNLQSDARFAEAFVRYRSTRGCGPLKIAAELYPRRLDSELLKSVLYADGPDWEALCMDALRKKFRVTTKPSADERQRWQRFLQQRGFEHQQIRAVFRALQTLSDAETP